MVIYDLLNTIDFDLNIREKFVYNFYDNNEKTVDDNNISNKKNDSHRHIELNIRNIASYDRRISQYFANVDITELEQISGKKLNDKDISFFNKLNKKENYLINLQLDRKDFEISSINDFYNVNLVSNRNAIDFVSRNFKLKINKNNKNSFLSSNSYQKFLTEENIDSIEKINKLDKNISLDQSKNIKLNEDFNVYKKTSIYNSQNEFYYLNVGYLVEKFELIKEDIVLKDTRFFINKKLNEIKKQTNEEEIKIIDNLNIHDNSIKYGKTYFYIVYPVFLFTQPCKNDYHFLNTYLLCDYPYKTKEVLCKEFKRPEAPSYLNFIYSEKEKSLKIKWSKPIEKQGDIKGYQVFKRESLSMPYDLLSQISFHNEYDAYEKNKNISMTKTTTTKKHVSEYTDKDFRPGKIQIYTVCSVDAHGYTSNYGSQIAVTYDYQNKKCILDQVSKSGAPLHMPNLIIPRKTKFFHNDESIVSNTPYEKNVNKFTLYITPEAHSIVKNNASVTKLLGDNYKLSIYKLENGENVVKDINIKNFNRQ